MSQPVKKTARKPAAKPAAEVLVDEEQEARAEIEGDAQIRPVVIVKKPGRGDTPVERVTIFELDGVEYGVPKEPSAALVLKYLLDWRESGYNMALQGVGVTLLGPANMAVLAASSDVDEDDLKGIFANVGVVFFGSDTYRSIMGAEGN